MAAVNEPADVVSIDGGRYGAPEICGAEPYAFVVGNGSGRYLVEPHLLTIERWPNVAQRSAEFRRKPVEVFAIEGVDQMDLAAAEAQHFHVAILLNIEPYGIDVRKSPAALILLPIVGIALQQQQRTGP